MLTALQAKVWSKLVALLASFDSGESGQSMVEYALIIFLIAVAVAGIVMALGNKLGGVFQQISNSL